MKTDTWPKYIVLNTHQTVKKYVEKIQECIGWFPDPAFLGCELIYALHSKQYANQNMMSFAIERAIGVSEHGTYIREVVNMASRLLVEEIFEQVSTLDPYIADELAYDFYKWTGFQLVLRKISNDDLHELQEDQHTQDITQEAANDFDYDFIDEPSGETWSLYPSAWKGTPAIR